MPGLYMAIALNGRGNNAPECSTLAGSLAQPIVRTEDWRWRELVSAPGSSAGTTDAGSAPLDDVDACTEGEITAIVAGYLTSDDPSSREADARHIVRAYAKGNVAAVESLDGSFVIAVIDRAARQVHVLTDRVGSRPAYWAQAGEMILVASEVKCLEPIAGVDRAIVPGSLASMLLNASLLDEHTYWRGVSLLGPARRLTADRGGVHLARYWRRSFIHESQQASTSADVFGNAVTDATRLHLARFRRPVLALSGGIDSRVILGAWRRACDAGGCGTGGCGTGVSPVSPLSLVTWGVDHAEAGDGDVQTACRVVASIGAEHELRLQSLDAFPESAPRTVWLTDGMTGHLGAHPDADGLARELSTRHDAVLLGNHLFDGGGTVRDIDEAFRRARLHFGPHLRLVRFLMRRDAAEAAVRGYDAQRSELLESLVHRRDAGATTTDPNDFKDALYWRTGFCRRIMSQAAVFRRHLQYVSPLTAGPLLELDRAWPADQRAGKRMFTHLSRIAFEDVFAVPASAQHSRTDWRRRLAEPGPVPRWIVETLLEPLAAFDEWFDPTAVRAWLARTTAEGSTSAWPGGSTWLRRRSAETRATLVRHATRARRIINLLTLKLWFARFAR